MSEKANTTKSSKMELTQRDMELCAMAFKCMETQPKIDYEKFAKMAGWAGAPSASARWSETRRKLLSDGVPTTIKRRGPKPKGNANTEDSAPKVPTTKKRQAPKAVDDDDEDDDDDMEIVVAPAAKKAKAAPSAAKKPATKPRSRMTLKNSMFPGLVREKPVKTEKDDEEEVIQNQLIGEMSRHYTGDDKDET